MMQLVKPFHVFLNKSSIQLSSDNRPRHVHMSLALPWLWPLCGRFCEGSVKEWVCFVAFITKGKVPGSVRSPRGRLESIQSPSLLQGCSWLTGEARNLHSLTVKRSLWPFSSFSFEFLVWSLLIFYYPVNEPVLRSCDMNSGRFSDWCPL